MLGIADRKNTSAAIAVVRIRHSQPKGDIFQINQVLKFGKFLAVIQRDPTDPNRTIATAYIALAVKARIIENKKKYENVPVLRNLVPAQVLVGKSSFNTGSSISAGLPLYTRNKIKAVADFFEQQ